MNRPASQPARVGSPLRSEQTTDGFQTGLYLFPAWEGAKHSTRHCSSKLLATTSKTNTCPVCELNAWAKPDAHIICGD